MIGCSLDPGLEYRFQCVTNVVCENRAERNICHAGKVGLIAFDSLLPLRSFEPIGASISGLDGLNAFVADMTYPQSQSVIAQELIIGIEIDRIQRFVNRIMKSARKMRIIAASTAMSSGATRSFNSISFWLAVHEHNYQFPMT